MPTTIIRTCTAGDRVELPALTLTVADGYDIDDAVVRVRIFAPPVPGTVSIDFDREGVDTANLVLVDGELTITILEVNWPDSWAEATRQFQATVEVEVEFPDVFGPETVSRDSVIKVLPQAILRGREPIEYPLPEPPEGTESELLWNNNGSIDGATGVTYDGAGGLAIADTATINATTAASLGAGLALADDGSGTGQLVYVPAYPAPPEGTPENAVLGADGEWRAVGQQPALDWDLWISSAGNDSNPGTQAEPLASYNAAFAITGDDISGTAVVHVSGTVSTNGVLWPSNVTGNLSIVGEDGWTEIFPTTLVTSQTGLVIDCSGAAPGWTIDAWCQYKVELIRSGVVYSRASIGANTATTLTLIAPKATALVAGDSIRIVRPTTTVAAQSSLRAIPGGAFSDYVVMNYGTQYIDPPSSAVHWCNINFTGNNVFSGSHNFVGCRFEGSAILLSGSHFSGISMAVPGVASCTADYSLGNGINTRTSTPNNFLIYVQSGAYFSGGAVCGTLQVDGGVVFISEGLKCWNVQSYGPSSYLWLKSATTRLVSIDAFYGRQGSQNVFANSVNVRTGPLRTAQMGYLLLSNVTFSGAAAALNAISGGIIELVGNTYATLGAATVGGINPLPRAAATWAAGDSVVTAATALALRPVDGGSAIFRST